MRFLGKLISFFLNLIFAAVFFILVTSGALFVISSVTGESYLRPDNVYRMVLRQVKTYTDQHDLPVISDVLPETGTEGVQNESADLSRFDPLFYPYYGMLDDSEKAVYGMLYDAVLETKRSVDSQRYELSYEQAEQVWEALFYDHPEFFWLQESSSFSYFEHSKTVTSIELHYNSLADHLDYNRELFNNACASLLEEAKLYQSDYEKELFLHNALIRLCEYDTEASNSQSAYSALIDHYSVCAGYTKAYQLLMIECGIPCYYVSGWSRENHAWNIVLLDGEYYNVDLTWDDGTGTFAFFNRTDNDLNETHMRTGWSLDLPACTGQLHHNTEPIPPLRFS